MSWVAVAIVGGAAIGAIATNKAAKAQAGATSEASRIQAGTADRQLQELARQYDVLRQDLAPYREAGTGALQALTTGQVQETPLYNVLLEKGTQAVNRAASAQGFLNTPQQQLELQRQGQQAATMGIINPLFQLANIGQASAAQTGAGALATGQAGANVLGQSGAAQAQNALLAGQARASTYQGYGNIANNALNQYMQWRGYNQAQQPVQGDAYQPARSYYGY